MLKRMMIVMSVVLMSFSLSYAKNIVVGSHGGLNAYFSPALGENYEPFSVHAGKDKDGKDKDSNWIGNEINKEYGAHGIDAAIVYFNEKSSGNIYAMISEDSANPSVAYYFIKDNYSSGDKVFLLGYSAGGKFVLNLSEMLNSADVPVHILGMIDPIMGTDITIPSNVQKVAVYYQENDDYLNGFNHFVLNDTSETSYFSDHPKLIDGVIHGTIHYSQDVWKDFGQKMVDAGDNGSDDYEVCTGFSNAFVEGQVKDSLINSQWDSICLGYHPLVERFRDRDTCKLIPTYTPRDGNLYVYGNYCNLKTYNFVDSVEFSGGLLPDPNDPNPTIPEPPDPDIHINSLDIRLIGGGYVKEIQKTLYWGQSFPFEGRAEFENKSSAEAKGIDADYRITDSRSNFNEDATKIDEDGLFNINPGEREENSISPITVRVSEDGTKVYYSQGSMTKSFDVINGYSKVYIFADIEVDGDKDISSPSDHDEYGKIELIILEPPCQPNFTQNPTSGVRPLVISFTNTSISNVADCTYTWSFGDGGTSNVYNPAYSYNNAGTFTPKLTASSYSYGYSGVKTGNAIPVANPIPPSMMITNPTGNDNWRSDNTKHITWNRYNFPTQGNVRIDYTLDSGAIWRNIDSYTANDGSRYWDMCKSYTKDSGNSYVRICSIEYGVCATSAKFYIDHAKGCK